MKQILFGLAIAALSIAACNSDTKTQQSSNTDSVNTSVAALPQAPTAATPISGIVSGYLHLKNALASDNGNDAASAGSEILNALGKVDTASLTAEQKQSFISVADDVRENADHISKNAGKIAHQREHFESLSKDVYDLVKAFGGGQKLYYEHCPMAFDGKGASWVSEIKEIKNPYFGSEMLECGEVKEELK